MNEKWASERTAQRVCGTNAGPELNTSLKFR